MGGFNVNSQGNEENDWFIICFQIWVPIVSVSKLGCIYIQNRADYVKKILRELTKFCQLSALSADPRLARSENVGFEPSMSI